MYSDMSRKPLTITGVFIKYPFYQIVVLYEQQQNQQDENNITEVKYKRKNYKFAYKHTLANTHTNTHTYYVYYCLI